MGVDKAEWQTKHYSCENVHSSLHFHFSSSVSAAHKLKECTGGHTAAHLMHRSPQHHFPAPPYVEPTSQHVHSSILRIVCAGYLSIFSFHDKMLSTLFSFCAVAWSVGRPDVRFKLTFLTTAFTDNKSSQFLMKLRGRFFSSNHLIEVMEINGFAGHVPAWQRVCPLPSTSVFYSFVAVGCSRRGKDVETWISSLWVSFWVQIHPSFYWSMISM